MPFAISPRAGWSLLLLTLAADPFLRLHGIGFSLPSKYHVDEPGHLIEAFEMREDNRAPKTWNNPPTRPTTKRALCILSYKRNEDRKKSFFEELGQQFELIKVFSPHDSGDGSELRYAELSGPTGLLRRRQRSGPSLRIYRVRRASES